MGYFLTYKGVQARFNRDGVMPPRHRTILTTTYLSLYIFIILFTFAFLFFATATVLSCLCII